MKESTYKYKLLASHVWNRYYTVSLHQISTDEDREQLIDQIVEDNKLEYIGTCDGEAHFKA